MIVVVRKHTIAFLAISLRLPQPKVKIFEATIVLVSELRTKAPNIIIILRGCCGWSIILFARVRSVSTPTILLRLQFGANTRLVLSFSFPYIVSQTTHPNDERGY